MAEKLIISLGSSCDGANQLKRKRLNNAHNFFDFIWNEYDGLKTVSEIIKNDFDHFDDIKNYTKTSTHPILTWKPFNINRYYPNFVFMHHNTTKPQVIESFKRKIERTRSILSNPAPKVFIYYRHYSYLCTGLDILKKESLEFCEMFKTKYEDKNFYLLSLVVYDSESADIEKINSELRELRKEENENLKFDFVYKRNDENRKLNEEFHMRSWDNVFEKYNIRK